MAVRSYRSCAPPWSVRFTSRLNSHANYSVHDPGYPFLDPLQPTRHTSVPCGVQDDEDLASIRDALVASVYKQLDEEKRAHTRTREQADAEILRLRAMVARRDAELEACATHSAHQVSLTSSLAHSSLTTNPCTHPGCAHDRRGHGQPPASSHLSARTGTQGEEERLLTQSQMRQRMLEREIEFLHNQVCRRIRAKFQAPLLTNI